jgi:chemotaxis protein methyltransferase CheR
MPLKSLSQALVAQLAGVVERNLGLQFAPERWEDLERGILAAMRECGQSGAEEFAQSAAHGAPNSIEMNALARNLTIGETYFFRDENFFHLLEHSILPGIIAKRRSAGMPFLRIWSAACCTGEEPYSIAMLLQKLLPDIGKWTVTILGTDLNTAFLEKAREGKYGDWSLRALPAGGKTRFFEAAGDKRHTVKSSVRAMVHFAQLNLASEAYPSPLTNTEAMDLILCRNALMYMSAEKADAILARLGKSLSENGLLALAPVEATLAHGIGLTASIYGTPILSARRSAVKPSPAAFPQFGQRPSGTAPTAAAPVPAVSAPFTPGPAYPDSYTQAGPAADTDKSEEALALERLERDPADFAAMAALSKAYADQGRLDDALALGLKAAEANETSETTFLVATILREKGADHDAVAWLERLVEKDEGFVMAHFALGSLHRRMEGSHGDLSHFRRALGLAERLPAQSVLPGSGGELTSGMLKRLLMDILNPKDAP